ncbi:hypothetical protein Y032_0244g3524 [Ancylostoma ceylanicum]|uniref:Uncharacterized protein n=1 Tax=Ancylostoma ceylanicum TaxID=53326 RepID=A0A016SE34_9BILA|nr:hypothetical protein Y032_0244g3524 [Ancylostoma ceylanicum]
MVRKNALVLSIRQMTEKSCSISTKAGRVGMKSGGLLKECACRIMLLKAASKHQYKHSLSAQPRASCRTTSISKQGRNWDPEWLKLPMEVNPMVVSTELRKCQDSTSTCRNYVR